MLSFEKVKGAEPPEAGTKKSEYRPAVVLAFLLGACLLSFCQERVLFLALMDGNICEPFGNNSWGK